MASSASSNSDSEDNDVGGICDHCHKSCQTIHTFLRHVSHSESCKASYSQFFLEKLKKKAKIISKRKFYRNLSKSEKDERYEREKHWRRANAKKRYVAKWKYKYDDGKEFESVFKSQFDIATKEVEEKLGHISTKAEYLDWISEEKSIDYVFEKEIDKMEDWSDEENFDYEKFEAILEEKYEKRLEQTKHQEEETWKSCALSRILHNFYFLTLNKAYLRYIDEFKKIYEEATEVSLDQVMYNAEVSIKLDSEPKCQEMFDNAINEALEESFQKTLRNEVSNSCQNNSFSEKLLDLTKKQFDLKMKRDKVVKEYYFQDTKLKE